MSETRYRLREGKRIVGYSRELESRSYFSKDAYWWTGNAIEHDTKDEATGWKDKNNRHLFENDIIQVRFLDPFRSSELYRIRKQYGMLVLTKMENENNESLLQLNKAKSIEWISYTFINLETIFGVSDQ